MADEDGYVAGRSSLADWASKLHGRIDTDEDGQDCIRCPGPGHSLADDSMLVRFDEEASGGFRVQSFCIADDDPKMLRDFVRSMVGLPNWKPNGKSNGHAKPKAKGVITDKYPYHDAEGQPVLLVNRLVPKNFLQQRPDGAGGWDWGGIDELAKVPFRLPELIEAGGKGQTIIVNEGEKGALACWANGLAGTCSPGGAGKWPKHFAQWFAGLDVIVLADNDAPGRKHADQVEANLRDVAASVKIINLPGLPPGGDICDWLAAGGDPATIVNLRAGPPARGLTAVDLWSMIFPPIKFAVPDIIAEGLTLIAGAPKRGKSWLALDLCTTVAFGGMTLGDRKCIAGDVLYCALEDSPRRMKERLHRVCQLRTGPPGRLTVWFGPDLPRLGQGCEEALREWLVEHPERRLVVIDTLNYIRPERTRDEDPYSYDYRSATLLQRMASEFGVAIVLVHHTRKTVAEDYLESISGTNGLTGGSDAVIVLERQGDGSTVLKGRGRDIEEFELAIKFDKDECRWRVTGDVEEARDNGVKAKILAHLRDAPWPLTAVEIAAQAGLRRNTVEVNLFRMANAGQVSRIGRGKYALPSVGGDADHTIVSFGPTRSRQEPPDDEDDGD
jgi:hypothetical protein